MAHRAERINREIGRQLAVIINQMEWSAERITVASTELSPKFDYVRVYVGVWPLNIEKKAIHELNEKKGLIKKELAAKLRMRLMPELGFYPDRGSEAAIKVSELLEQIEETE